MGQKTTVDLNDTDEWIREKYKVANDRVGARVSITRNLGDYNSLSISLMREADAEDGEDYDTAVDRVYHSVEEKIEAKLAEYDE